TGTWLVVAVYQSPKFHFSFRQFAGPFPHESQSPVRWSDRSELRKSHRSAHASGTLYRSSAPSLGGSGPSGGPVERAVPRGRVPRPAIPAGSLVARFEFRLQHPQTRRGP